ncbi:helix-turn-helix domain-containing protein, partial [Lamprobacter modestohalophilus]|uniref:helix-turn-helix domain-containing protein n=1 Tax=Lamprobacter modestohalophilus TaxID=1064514 RepID=UPI002ADEB897
LENRLSQALLQTHHALITPEMLELGGGRAGQQGPLGGDAETASGRHASGSAGDQASVLRSLDEVAAAHIQQVLDHTLGHKGQACEILGISRPALDRKIEKYQLRVMKR